MPTTHKITTIQQLLDVATPENIDSLMADFKDWLRLSMCLNALNDNAKNQGFIWIDDRKNNLEFIDFNLTKDGEIVRKFGLTTKKKL